MGCYCCGCDQAYEDSRLDTAKGLINTEANAVLKSANEINAKLLTLAVQPFRTYDVPVWNSGDYSGYQRAIEDVKQRRQLEKRPTVFKRMLKPHYEAALLQAQTFYLAQGEPRLRPDPDWWIIVGTLAANAEALYSLKKETEILEARFHLHQHTTETIQKQLQGTGSLKPPETASVDKDSRAKMDKLAADLKLLEPFSSECARLLREFYVDVDEALVREAEAKEREPQETDAKEARQHGPQETDAIEAKETDPFMPQPPAKPLKKPETK